MDLLLQTYVSPSSFGWMLGHSNDANLKWACLKIGELNIADFLSMGSLEANPNRVEIQERLAQVILLKTDKA